MPSAEQELADVWLAASDRAAVTRAAHQIDQELRTDSHTRGELHAGDRRILYIEPLGVLFEISLDDRIARILQVWAFVQDTNGRQP
jgi:hypothetical protein